MGELPSSALAVERHDLSLLEGTMTTREPFLPAVLVFGGSQQTMMQIHEAQLITPERAGGAALERRRKGSTAYLRGKLAIPYRHIGQTCILRPWRPAPPGRIGGWWSRPHGRREG